MKRPADNHPHRQKEKDDIKEEYAIVADTFEQEGVKEFDEAKVDEQGQYNRSRQGKVQIGHAMRHQVALPPTYSYTPIQEHVPWETPAKTYPFQLDSFQQTAIWSIERNESVLVAAHTSAGKTVVAEYAIATCLKQKQRIIYTSPIKALSNQKYREFQAEFQDVGLMTGDLTINPTATILVMTTEILRSMMYRGSEVMREVAWVVFDEIHYLRDKARGVVWEETIILLPHKVRYVFLSATIPNAKQFAEWICKIHNQPCHVVYTNFRPVPLQHYVFPAGGDGIHLCVDEKSVFREDNFAKAIGTIKNESDRVSAQRGSKGGKKDLKKDTDLFKLMKMIWLRNYQPVIVFSFSKRDCESFAMQMSKLDFNSDQEKELVGVIYKNAMSSLSTDDQSLPQIVHLLPLLQKGIGIHHSGLLQILKEVIEILFQEGLIKVLFATETFSIGLNMPAKTVVFTSVQKFDGTQARPLGSGEYVQMSGRSGRRGLDDRGIVIMMVDQKMEPEVARNMLKGEPDVLNSAFHLTYSMILNLMRVEGVSPEYMLKRSFYQFQHSDTLPSLEIQARELADQRDGIVIENESVIAEYYTLEQSINGYEEDIRRVMTHPSYCLEFLQPGRLVQIKVGDQNFGWSVITGYTKKSGKKTGQALYLVDILAQCSTDYDPEAPKAGDGELQNMAVDLDCIQQFAGMRMNLPRDLKSKDSRSNILRQIKEASRRFSTIPLVDPVADMKITDETFLMLLSKCNELKAKLLENSLSTLENADLLAQQHQLYQEKMDLDKKCKAVLQMVDQAQSVLQLDELKYRKDILLKLEYVDDKDVVQVKGRVACEIQAGDELVLGELLFNNTFNDLTIPQTVALLSCAVCQEKSNDEVIIRADMQPLVKMLKETARRVGTISIENCLQLDLEQYVEGFHPDMVNCMYAWAEGAKFSEVCKMTDLFEGSIIRMIRREEELLRQMVAASKQIGNVDLEEKFRACSVAIKRDIAFAASLYL